MANERDSRVTVVHGCFPEGGDSIYSKCLLLGVLSLPAKLQDN